MQLTPVTVTKEVYAEKPLSGRFYLGDTLSLLDELLQEYRGRVKLIYIDPPFLTGKQFTMRVRVGEKEWRRSLGSLVLPAYSDAFDTFSYFSMMERVLTACKELLREDGMLFVHCDFRANAKLRLILDDLFGFENFLNEIIWVYRTGGTARKYFSRKHDVILFYRKGKKYDFHIDSVYECRKEPRENHMRRHIDPDGRVYRSIRANGRVYTYYDDDPVAPSDVWDDLSHLQQKDPQRTGYDTQKPLKLLERIIKCASREGELVMDLFSGSGTTLEAAARLNRPFIGVDQCPLTVNILRRRLADTGFEIMLPPQSASPACQVTVEKGVGFYRLALNHFAAEPLYDYSPDDLVDNWAAGYFDGDIFRVFAEERRTRKTPALSGVLELPVFFGRLGVRISDIRGKNYYYRGNSLEINNLNV